MLKNYESEATLFLRQLKSDKPHLADEQLKGRAIWWDRPQDPDTQARLKASRVAQAPYVYQTKG